MNDHTVGVLEGLGYSLGLLPKHSKVSRTISERIANIVERSAQDLESRMKATA